MALIERFTPGGNLYADGSSTFATLVQLFRRQAENRDARDNAMKSVWEGGDASTLQAAKSADVTTLTSAKNDATNKANTAESRAKAHADAGDAGVKADAYAYTDASFNAVGAGSATDAAIDAAVDRAVLAERVAPASIIPDGGVQAVGKGEIVVNVKDYGAVGNGVADDEAAINAAITATMGMPRVVLYFPAGKYLFHHLRIERDNITLKGEGHETVLATTYLHTDAVQAVRMIGNNLAVRDLFIETQNPYMAPQAGFGSYELLRIGGNGTNFTSGVLVENVRFYKGAGCNVYRTANVTIRGCHYVGSHGNSFGSVEVRHDVKILGNTATDGNDDLIAITCDQNVPGGTQRVVISGNVLARTDAKAICTSGVASAVITGNHCEETRGPAIQIFQDTAFGLEASRRVNVTGNTIIRGGKWFGADTATYMHTTAHQAPHGIHVAGQDITVTANSIYESHGRGVQADGVTRYRITDNTIDSCGQAGINIGNPDLNEPTRNPDGIVSGNMLSRSQSGIVVGSATRVVVTGNRLSAFHNGTVGESRGIFYGYVTDSAIHTNVLINSDGAAYGVRARPSSINTQTVVWGNTLSVPGAGGPSGAAIHLGAGTTNALLYRESGALKYRGDNGTVTTIAAS